MNSVGTIVKSVDALTQLLKSHKYNFDLEIRVEPDLLYAHLLLTNAGKYRTCAFIQYSNMQETVDLSDKVLTHGS